MVMKAHHGTACDAAVLSLLYGAGLRISEALSLKRKDFPEPGGGDVIRVTGKGNKTRMVPLLRQVVDQVAAYAALSSASISLPPPSTCRRPLARLWHIGTSFTAFPSIGGRKPCLRHTSTWSMPSTPSMPPGTTRRLPC
jgi:integrase